MVYLPGSVTGGQRRFSRKRVRGGNRPAASDGSHEPPVPEGYGRSAVFDPVPGQTAFARGGFFDGDRLIAVLDLILGYPDESAAFVGFFMTDASIQNRGIGSSIIGELCRTLKEAGYREARLGWVKGNPQSARFWRRNGFRETGASYETDGYTVVIARRDL